MENHDKFDARIAQIHDPKRVVGASMDIRHEEFKALTDTFLGEDYDPAKLAKVEQLQILAQIEQMKKYQQFTRGQISPAEYVSGANETWEYAFVACERVLGSTDFRKLFDAAPKDMARHLDLDTFLAAEGLLTAGAPLEQLEIPRNKQSHIPN